MDKFVFFGGKGGVGKTTVSSAYGLRCAREGLKTLLVSTDPAHSTSDVFDQQFGDEPSAVDGYDDLWAMEIDPEEEVADHMMEIKRTMNDQVSAGIVNEIDRQIELAHQTPGAYEAALFDRFIDVMQNADEYDRVVFDTSPTGGTLRLLSLPDFLEGWVDRLVDKRAESIDLFEKAAIGEREARRQAENDPVIERLRERKRQFEFAGEQLREHSTFHLVMNPDELSIEETERAVGDLTEYGLGIEGLVVNKVTPEPDDGEAGRGAKYLRQKRETERQRIDEIESRFDVPVTAVIETRIEEIKGELLGEVADELNVTVVADPHPQ